MDKCPRCLEEIPLITKSKAKELSERAKEWMRSITYVIAFSCSFGMVAAGIGYINRIGYSISLICIAVLILSCFLMLGVQTNKKYCDLLYRFLEE